MKRGKKEIRKKKRGGRKKRRKMSLLNSNSRSVIGSVVIAILTKGGFTGMQGTRPLLS